MNRFFLLFVVVTVGCPIFFFWSLEYEIKHSELLRGIAILCLGIMLLVYNIVEKVNTISEKGKGFQGIVFGMIGIVIGLAEIFRNL